VAVGYARAYYQDYKIRQKIQSLQDQVNQLGYKKLESMDVLKYVTSEAFVEEKARSEFNLKKPGENVLIVKNTAEADKSVGFEPVEKPTLNNPAKWWYYFIYKTLPKD
jgi:3-deoxy-D-manno-octulosonic-acid transferase